MYLSIQMGGDMFPITGWFGAYAGVLDVTEGGMRENGLILPGVKEDGSANNIPVDAMSHFDSWYAMPAQAVIDASYVKLQEISLGYTLPLKNSKVIKSLNFSVYGRNLALLYLHKSNYLGIDPEVSNGTGVGSQGFENYAAPGTRSVGFKVGVNF